MPSPIQNPTNPNIPGQTIVEAAIVQGAVTQDDDKALFPTLDDPFGIFTDYKIVNRYENDRHIYMLPISSPGGFSSSQGTAQAAFVQLASPTLLWICDWTAARFNSQPQIPDTNIMDKRWILLDVHYEPAMVTVAADGYTTLYRISGTYVYGCTEPNDIPVNDLVFPRPPWLTDSFLNGRDMPDTTLIGNLIERQVNAQMRP